MKGEIRYWFRTSISIRLYCLRRYYSHFRHGILYFPIFVHKNANIVTKLCSYKNFLVPLTALYLIYQNFNCERRKHKNFSIPFNGLSLQSSFSNWFHFSHYLFVPLRYEFDWSILLQLFSLVVSPLTFPSRKSESCWTLKK